MSDLATLSCDIQWLCKLRMTPRRSLNKGDIVFDIHGGIFALGLVKSPPHPEFRWLPFPDTIFAFDPYNNQDAKGLWDQAFFMQLP
jgi:hypothetical protein